MLKLLMVIIWLSQTQDLLNTSQMLIPLSHCAHGKGARHKLHVAALCGGRPLSNSTLPQIFSVDLISLSLSWHH